MDTEPKKQETQTYKISIKSSREHTLSPLLARLAEKYDLEVDVIFSHRTNWVFFTTIAFYIVVSGEEKKVEEFENVLVLI